MEAGRLVKNLYGSFQPDFSKFLARELKLMFSKIVHCSLI